MPLVDHKRRRTEHSHRCTLQQTRQDGVLEDLQAYQLGRDLSGTVLKHVDVSYNPFAPLASNSNRVHHVQSSHITHERLQRARKRRDVQRKRSRFREEMDFCISPRDSASSPTPSSSRVKVPVIASIDKLKPFTQQSRPPVQLLGQQGPDNHTPASPSGLVRLSGVQLPALMPSIWTPRILDMLQMTEWLQRAKANAPQWRSDNGQAEDAVVNMPRGYEQSSGRASIAPDSAAHTSLNAAAAAEQSRHGIRLRPHHTGKQRIDVAMSASMFGNANNVFGQQPSYSDRTAANLWSILSIDAHERQPWISTIASEPLDSYKIDQDSSSSVAELDGGELQPLASVLLLTPNTQPRSDAELRWIDSGICLQALPDSETAGCLNELLVDADVTAMQANNGRPDTSQQAPLVAPKQCDIGLGAIDHSLLATDFTPRQSMQQGVSVGCQTDNLSAATTCPCAVPRLIVQQQADETDWEDLITEIIFDVVLTEEPEELDATSADDWILCANGGPPEPHSDA